MKRSKRGFTLAELLIVVAIIGVLVAIAIPVFTSQLEKSRESVDFANVRSAYAEVMAAANLDDSTATYGGEPIKQPDGSFKAVVSPLKQQVDDWSTDVKNMSIGGVPSTDWIGTPKAEGQCTVRYIPSRGIRSIIWGDGFALWSTISGTNMNVNEWWNPSAAREESFNNLRSTPNEERKAADIEILNALANYFNGMSADEAKKILGDSRYNSAITGSSMLFQYGQDGGGSIRISSMDTDYVPYFTDLGYDANIYVTRTSEYGGWAREDNYTNHGNNYVDQYLFTSDEMLGTAYAQGEVMHNINIKFNVENGKVTNTQVWADRLRDDGFTSGS